MTQYSEIQDTRAEIDNLVVDLSVRLSTLQHDTEFYQYYPDANQTYKEFNITVGCDEISTSPESDALVTGDTLTILGRTFLGSYLENPAVQVCLVSSAYEYLTQVCFAL